ncbi:MAG TPA: hypothetical protein DIW43_16410 [Spongiibacteraceae bacterium]|nr:hypothetical protein [Spongiibacteraceae bacterium]|tara:strand:- start:350 stop:676 length:327 start_codon:yes stop_codon:yes gene_type:complete
MDQYITLSEIALLLAIFWCPVFALAAFIQWCFLNANLKLVAWLVGGFLAEVAIAFGIWLSPLHQYLLGLDFLGGAAIGSLPLQAAVLASLLITSLLWWVSRHGAQKSS